MKHAFADELYKQMKENDKVWLLCGDVGFGVLDKIKKDFPDRFLNMGVAEQNMVGVACGMAHSGLIPFVYTITPFLVYRALEFIRNDVNYDKANVKLIAMGRGDDYKDLGMSHCAKDDKQIMFLFRNIMKFWPKSKTMVRQLVGSAVRINRPMYINLKR